MNISEQQEAIARKVWRQIRSTRNRKTKSEIEREVNRGAEMRVSTAAMFSPGVRRYLEAKADSEGKAVIIEHGQCYTTTQAEDARRRSLREVTRHVTHGLNLGSEGNGLGLLRRSDNPLDRELAVIQQGIAYGAQLTVGILDGIRHGFVTEDRARRQATRERQAKVNAGTK